MIAIEYYDRIEAYLMGRLKPEQNTQLEIEIASNSELQKLFVLTKDLFEFLKDFKLHDTLDEVAQLRELRNAAIEQDKLFYEENENLANMLQTINEIHEEHLAKKERRKIRPVFFYSKVRLSVIVVIIAIASITAFYFSTQTASVKNSGHNYTIFSSITRSSSSTPVECNKAYEALVKRNYKEASIAINLLLKTDSFNYAWRYYQGIALLMQAQFSAAENQFLFIQDHAPNLFTDRATIGLKTCGTLKKNNRKSRQ